MEFKNRIKKLRKDKKLTQSQLSELTGITTSLISKYENGSKEVGLDNATRLAEALETSLDYLIRGEGEPIIKYQNNPNLNLDIFLTLKRQNLFLLYKSQNFNQLPKIIQNYIEEYCEIRSSGSLSLNNEWEKFVDNNHSKLFYKAIELGFFIEAFTLNYDELEQFLKENNVDIKTLLNINF